MKKIIKQYSLIEIFSAIFLTLIIVIFALSGIKLSVKINKQIQNIKIAQAVLFEAGEKLKNMNYDLIEDEVILSKNFNSGEWKSSNLNDLPNAELQIKISEPDGKNEGLKKIILQINWNEETKPMSLHPIALFKCKS